jgi:O-antigen/teichoic acid export membrane protein
VSNLARTRRLAAPGAMVGSVATGVAAQVLLVVSGVIVARALGPEDRGVVALVFVLVAVVGQIGSLGVPSAVTYWIAARGTSPHALLRELRRFRVAQLLVMLAAHVALLYLVLDPRTSASIVLLGGLSLLTTIAAVSQLYGLAVLQGLHRFRAFNAVRILNGALYTLAVIGLWVVDEATLVSVTLAYVAAAVVAAFATWLVVLRSAPRQDGVSGVPVRKLVGFGARSLLGSSPPVETFRLDQLLVGLVLSPVALGYYVVALSFTTLSRLVGQSIGMVTFPRVTAARGRAQQLRLARVDFLLGCVLCGTATVVLLVAMPGLLPLFFGTEFDAAVAPAQVLLVGGLFAAVRRILVDATRGFGWPLWGAAAEAATLLVVPGLLVASWFTESLTVMAAVVTAANFLGLLVSAPALFAFVHDRPRLRGPSRGEERLRTELAPRPLADDAN